MSQVDWFEIERMAKDWAKEAGHILKEYLLSNIKIKVESKSHPNDLVTEMDRKIESFLIHKISKHFPHHSFLGEEGSCKEARSKKGTVWIIDPIDGTTNFVHQQFNFAISIAVFHDGVGMVGVVYNVMGGEMFHALRGNGAFLNGKRLEKLKSTQLEKAILGLNTNWIVSERKEQPNLIELSKKVRAVRSYGSAAIEIAYVAANRLDGYISLRLSPWDFAAGLVLLEEVGGKYSTLNGERLDCLTGSSVFVGKPTLHEEVIQTFFHKGE